jgi:hypothetical protein
VLAKDRGVIEGRSGGPAFFFDPSAQEWDPSAPISAGPSGRAWLVCLVTSAALAVAAASSHPSAQEAPRLLMSDVLRVADRCGDDGIIVRARGQRGIWLDLNSKKQVSTSIPTAGWGRGCR